MGLSAILLAALILAGPVRSPGSYLRLSQQSVFRAPSVTFGFVEFNRVLDLSGPVASSSVLPPGVGHPFTACGGGGCEAGRSFVGSVCSWLVIILRLSRPSTKRVPSTWWAMCWCIG